MQGRKPSKDNLKLTGNGGRVIGSDNPPDNPPEWLQGVALAEWHRLMPLLAERSLMSPLDSILLAGFCQCYAEYLQAIETVRIEGQTITNSRGKAELHPLAKFAASQLVEMRKMAGEFGLSPAGRSRIDVPPVKSEHDRELEDFLDSGPKLPPGAGYGA